MPIRFQSLKGKKIRFTKSEKKIIEGLKPFIGGEWEGKIKYSSSVKRKDRDALRKDIKNKLTKIQGTYCIYCGTHEDHCGSKLQREHIAAKGKKYYPKFVFEPENLCLACHKCNVVLKGEIDVASGNKVNYKKNKFTIVHPYFDKLEDHIEVKVNKGQALIKKKPYSRKGKRTIELFELDSPQRTSLRSGLLISEEISFDDKYDDLLNEALKNKYVKK